VVESWLRIGAHIARFTERSSERRGWSREQPRDL
jgi:hypothetical protein